MTDQYASEADRVVSQMRARVQAREDRIAAIKGDAEELKSVREAAERDKEERRGLFSDAQLGAIRAIPGAIEETFDLIASIDESVLRAVGGVDLNPFDNTGKGFIITPSEAAELLDSGEQQSMFRMPEEGYSHITDAIPEPERFTGQFTESVGKFVMGFVGGQRILKGAQVLQGSARGTQLANAVLAGGYADASVFDGHEERLSDLLESIPDDSNWSVFKGSLTEYLAVDENDSELEGRMKNMLEGFGLGAVAEGLFAGVRGVKAWRFNSAAKKAVQRADEAKFEVTDSKPVADKKEAAKAADEADKKVAEGEAPEPVKPEAKVDEGEARALVEAQVRATVDIPPDKLDEFTKAVAEADEEAAFKILDDFNVDKIDWDNIESGDDIFAIIRATEKVFADHIDDVKGGVQSIEKTQRLGRLVGASAEQVTKLFDDVRGDKGIAARFYGANRIMLASAKRLKTLAAKALETKAPADEAAYMRQAQIHVSLQAHYKGAQTEIGRAMRMMREIKDEVAAEFSELDQIRAQFKTGNNSDAFRKHLDELANTGSLDAINRHVAETWGEKTKYMFIEYVINSMLSSVKTHAINFTSNILNGVLWTADRMLAGTVRGKLLGDDVAWREVRIDLYHKLHGFRAAGKLGLQAFKDGLPVTDARQRLEFANRKAIQMDGDSLIARTVNFAGEVVRIPGRLLITGDEFFKAWTRNSELQVQGFRQADKEASERGMKYGTDKYESYVERRTNQLVDPKNNSRAALDVRIAAKERARLATFQESPFTEGGAKWEQAMNSNALVKLVVAPFYRTPMNILRQGLIDRTPLALTVKAHREAIMKFGTRESDEAIARMTTGTAVMGSLWLMTGEGPTDDSKMIQLVGRIPYDSSMRATGVRDYSIRVGDKWYQFNRFDPLGMWVGMIADAKTIASSNEEGAGDMLQAASAAFLKNVVNKTWARSLSDLIETVEKIEKGRPATVERAWNKFLAGEAGKLIPQIIKSTRDLAGEREAKEVWGFYDTLLSQVPILNKDLPPRHDALGRPITWESGFGSMVNPFVTSPGDLSPVDQAMFDLNMTIRPMRKTYGSVELTDREYSELTGMVNDFGLEEILDGLVTSRGWDDMPDGVKTMMIKETIKKARDAARKRFASKPEIRKRLTEDNLEALRDFFSIDE